MPISHRHRKRAPAKPTNQTTANMNKKATVAVRKDRDGTGHLQGEMYEGNFFPPEMLKGYQEVDPNLPNRLIGWTEKESGHRRFMERVIIVGSFLLSGFSIISGLATVAGLGYLSYLFMINGNAAAGASIAVSISGVVGVFIYRKAKKEKEEKEEKKK